MLERDYRSANARDTKITVKPLMVATRITSAKSEVTLDSSAKACEEGGLYRFMTMQAHAARW